MSDLIGSEGQREEERIGRKGQRIESGEKCTKDGSDSFLQHNFRNVIPTLLPHFLVTKTNNVMWEGTTQGYEYQEVGITRGLSWRLGSTVFYQKKKRKPLLYSEVHNKALELNLLLHLYKA